MNEQSSRSHAIFTVTIQQQNPDIEWVYLIKQKHTILDFFFWHCLH
jgi:hypothetical protein